VTIEPDSADIAIALALDWLESEMRRRELVVARGPRDGHLLDPAHNAPRRPVPAQTPTLGSTAPGSPDNLLHELVDQGAQGGLYR
jgi:hypothetical protein